MLITQKATPGTLKYASPQMRQTGDGTIQIGGSHEHSGLDDRSDGAPIYQRSQKHKGAFGVCCHSGVTLAAAHAGPLSSWLLDDSNEDYKLLIEAMNNDRFTV